MKHIISADINDNVEQHGVFFSFVRHPIIHSVHMIMNRKIEDTILFPIKQADNDFGCQFSRQCSKKKCILIKMKRERWRW